MINFWKSIPMLIKFFLIFLSLGLGICFCGYYVKGWIQSTKKGQTVERFEEKIEHTSETIIEIYPPKESELGNRSIYKFIPSENNLQRS